MGSQTPEHSQTHTSRILVESLSLPLPQPLKKYAPASLFLVQLPNYSLCTPGLTATAISQLNPMSSELDR